jgi:hypothetical protein
LEISDVRVHLSLYGERLTAPEPDKPSGYYGDSDARDKRNSAGA